MGRAEAAALRGEMEALEAGAATLDADIRERLGALPNVLDADVPDGPDETANVVVKQVGEPRAFAFTPREHFELGEALGLMDFAASAKLAVANFDAQGLAGTLEDVVRQAALSSAGNAVGALLSACAWHCCTYCMQHRLFWEVPCCMRCHEPA